MAEGHRVPWFPAWGIRFPEALDDPQDVISIFNEWRPNQRWLLLLTPPPQVRFIYGRFGMPLEGGNYGTQ